MEFLRLCSWGWKGNDYTKVIKDEVIKNFRWSKRHRMIIKLKADKKYYETFYTEHLSIIYQDKLPYRGEPGC